MAGRFTQELGSHSKARSRPDQGRRPDAQAYRRPREEGPLTS